MKMLTGQAALDHHQHRPDTVDIDPLLQHRRVIAQKALHLQSQKEERL